MPTEAGPALALRPLKSRRASIACSSAAALARASVSLKYAQQQRKLVAAEPADHVGGAGLGEAASRRRP